MQENRTRNFSLESLTELKVASIDKTRYKLRDELVLYPNFKWKLLKANQ